MTVNQGAVYRERWNLSRAYAHRLIEAAEVSAMLPIGNTPVNEAQARELAQLKDDPDAVREVYTEVVEQTDGQPTARAVRDTPGGSGLPATLG